MCPCGELICVVLVCFVGQRISDVCVCVCVCVSVSVSLCVSVCVC